MERDLPEEVGQMLLLGWFACSTLVVAGFSLSAGVSHFLDWVYQKREKESLALGLLCLTLAGHAFALLLVHRSATVDEYVWALKGDLCLLFVAQPAFLWLVSEHMHVRAPRVLWLFAAYFAALFAGNAFSANSLMVSRVGGLLVRLLPGGEPYVSAILIPGPWRFACLAGTLATYICGLILIFRGRRNVERGGALVIGVSLVCMFTTWIQTIFLNQPFLFVLLMSHFAFLGFILLMGSALSSRYGRQALSLAETHRALQESEVRFRLLVEKAPEAIVVYDPEKGRLVDANTNAALMFGCRREDLLSPEPRQAALSESLSFLESIYSLAQRALSGEESVYEQSFRNLQGRDLVCEVRLTRLPSAGRPLIRASLVDITERKEAHSRQLEYQQRLRTLASELAIAEDRERTRIASFLHDQVAQELVAAKMKLDEVVARADGTACTTLAELREMLARATEDTYSLTFELSRPILHELGFIPAVEWLGEKTCEREGVRFTLKDDGVPKVLSQDLRSVCFDVVRELLRNVVKHAEASCVTVTTHVDAQRLWLSVQDDGVGFDMAKRGDLGCKVGGFGMFSVHERLEYLQGTICTESKPGEGTRVTFSVPLSDAELREDRN